MRTHRPGRLNANGHGLRRGPVLITLCWVLAACGGGSSDAEPSSELTSVEPSSGEADDKQVAAVSSAPVKPVETPPETTTGSAASAPTTTGSLSSADAFVADAVPMDYTNPTSRVLAYGDGFVQLRAIGDAVAVWASDDGMTWHEIESTPQLVGYPQAVSDGSRIVALIYPADGSVPMPWLSADGGATWTTLPLPARDSRQPSS